MVPTSERGWFLAEPGIEAVPVPNRVLHSTCVRPFRVVSGRVEEGPNPYLVTTTLSELSLHRWREGEEVTETVDILLVSVCHGVSRYPVKNAKHVLFWESRGIRGTRRKAPFNDGGIWVPQLVENTETAANGSYLFLDQCVFRFPVGVLVPWSNVMDELTVSSSVCR